jgi:membrane-associated phospholipid phosphatase
VVSICICAVGGVTSYAVASDPPADALVTLVTVPQDTLPDAPTAQVPVTETSLPLAILKERHDLIWLVPLGAATGVTLATDTDAMRNVSRDRIFNKDSVNASNYLLTSEITIPVALYGIGLFKHSAHGRETGILSGEALVDSVVLEEVTKIIFRRERPLYNNAAGDFFAPNVGTNSSFPSSHSMLAWTVAGVVAGQYPSKWVQVVVYSLASGVSVTRILGQEHFPTDVLIGGAAGWLIRHYVFKEHQLRHVKKKCQEEVIIPAGGDTNTYICGDFNQGIPRSQAP